MGLLSWLFGRSKPKKIKIGLALGSGGAKGFAHLGALKAFEENGIEFDIVAGASIGSVVGAFYSAGYTSTDISELLKRIDFSEITNAFMLKMDTSKLFNVINREIGEMNIEELKKPFKAVATEIESGEVHVFESGSVAMALCASSSIPPFFKPVLIDDVRYVDGAFSNSIPADLVKEMGADYVVGIDLSTRDTKPSLLSKIFPTYKSSVKEPWAKGYQYSDTMLHPDLNGYSSVAFWHGNEMYDIGYNHALTFIPKIKEDIENLTFKKKKKKV
ncbi:MAG: patatin-like phospholipase family protein [Clostridia bacterium]|nr:patatin-like phospholipase family protein [Clostridia bacterium]